MDFLGLPNVSIQLDYKSALRILGSSTFVYRVASVSTLGSHAIVLRGHKHKSCGGTGARETRSNMKLCKLSEGAQIGVVF